jgi:flagellar motor switch/type III secretory pathway protein FliN
MLPCERGDCPPGSRALSQGGGHATVPFVPPRPFPWAKLPRVDRRALTSLGALRSLLAGDGPAGRVLGAVRELVDPSIDFTPLAAGAAVAVTPAQGVVSVQIVGIPDPSEPPSFWLTLEAETPLALSLVAELVKRPPPRAVLGEGLSPALVGAFAAIVAAIARHVGVPAVVSGVSLAPAAMAPSNDIAFASFTATAFGQASHLRAFFPARLLEGSTPPWNRERLAALGELPLEIPVVACAVQATAADVASLSAGDAWILGGAWKLGSAKGPLAGDVWLANGASETGVRAAVEASGRVVLRGGLEDLSWWPMGDDAADGSALAAAVGDVPVVVRVEIGTARMKAREWAVLQPGDVVSLGAKLGSAVTLRVAGQAVAEGELVDLDGEVGVRIRERVAAAPR